MSEHLIYFALLGSCSGFIAGLLGVGGGLIIVPALILIFTQLGFTNSIIMPMAAGTSLFAIVFTSLSSIRTHHSDTMVQWPIVVKMAPGVLIGAYLGSWITGWLNTVHWEILFALFCWLVALKMAAGWKPPANRVLPGTLPLLASSLTIGSISSLFGIGGGSLTVPFLTWCNTPIKKAIGTSAACGFPIAVGGCIGFITAGWQHPDLPAHSLGYTYLPGLAGIVATSLIFAHFGAKLAHKLPVHQLKRAFSILLFAIGFNFLPI